MFCVTFYSFKGGVGRTMALVNTALLLARAGKKVLIVDFDLEAPGVPSYSSFRDIDCSKGLVDAVRKYHDTAIAEDISGYIQKANTDCGDVWVLPAGNHSSQNYSQSFSGIDWQDLYESKHGFLFFEDMRQQWAQHDGTGFDYVLIDSRTGHTDTAGICTRQLPDLVVNMFIPNEQNILGISPIVSEMAASEGAPRKKRSFLFCASNVPDVDDEDDILTGQFSLAREHFPEDIFPKSNNNILTLTHYASIEMITQVEFVVARPKSRLSKEYQRLCDKVTSFNLSDREGAIIRLKEILNSFQGPGRSTRFENHNSPDKLTDLLYEVRSIHSGDGQIEFLCAGIARQIGDVESEIGSLTSSIEQGYRVSQARTNRASAYSLVNMKSEAAEDLVSVIFDENSSAQESFAAVSKLRSLDSSGWVSRLIDRSDELRENSSLIDYIASESLRSRESAILFDDFIEKFVIDGRSYWLDEATYFNNHILLKIAALRPNAALSNIMSLPEENWQIQDFFNAAIARWMIEGAPDELLFEKVSLLGAKEIRRWPNLVQCLLLSASVSPVSDNWLEEIIEESSVIKVSGSHFNCDTFLLGSAHEISRKIYDYRGKLKAGKLITPSIVHEYQRLENSPHR